MHNDLRNHAREEIPEQTECELPVGPVVSVLHDLQSITLEIDLTVKVHLMKGLHGDLAFAIVPCPVFRVMELQVMLNTSTRVTSFLVLSR